MQLDRLYNYILLLTLTLTLVSAQTQPLTTNLNITTNNASSCYSISTSSCANQCLACYLQPGCIPCAVSATEFQCIPEFTYDQNGSIVLGNNTCVNINTTYGSWVAQPQDCVTQGLGNWVYKLTTRRDLSLFSFNDQLTYNNSFINYTTNVINQLFPIINLYSNGSYGSLLNQTQNQTALLGQQVANTTSSSSWCAADNNATGSFLYYAEPQWQAMQEDRILAQNASLTNATLTAQYVQQYFFLASGYYCNATQRLLQRVYEIQNISSDLENAQIVNILSIYKDIAQINVDNATCQNNTLCNWNNTNAQQLLNALYIKQGIAWSYLYSVEGLKAYLNVYIPKVLALQQLKCVVESNATIGNQLNSVIASLQNQTYTNLATLNQSTYNPTNLNVTLDELTEFVVEVQDVNATVVNQNDSSANNLTWFFSVQSDLNSLTQNVTNVSDSFCVSLRAFFIAFYGLNGSEIQCNGSNAQLVSFYSNVVSTNSSTVNTTVITTNATIVNTTVTTTNSSTVNTTATPPSTTTNSTNTTTTVNSTTIVTTTNTTIITNITEPVPVPVPASSGSSGSSSPSVNPTPEAITTANTTTASNSSGVTNITTSNTTIVSTNQTIVNTTAPGSNTTLVNTTVSTNVTTVNTTIVTVNNTVVTNQTTTNTTLTTTYNITELLNSPVLPDMSYGPNPSFVVFNITVVTFPSTASNNILPITPPPANVSNTTSTAPSVVIIPPVNTTVPAPAVTYPAPSTVPANETSPPYTKHTIGNPPGWSSSSSLVTSVVGLVLLVCCSL